MTRNFYNKSMRKNVQVSIQYMAPGFEPMTYLHESSPITTRPGLPPFKIRFFPRFFPDENFKVRLNVGLSLGEVVVRSLGKLISCFKLSKLGNLGNLKTKKLWLRMSDLFIQHMLQIGQMGSRNR